MSDKPINPLRQRMIDDTTARRFKEKVQKDYVRHVRTFAAFVGRSPDTVTKEFAAAVRTRNIERVRQALAAPEAAPEGSHAETDCQAEAAWPARRCPCCGGRMIIVETFEGPRPARSPSPSRIRIDTS